MLRVGQVMSRLSVCLYSYHTIGDALTLIKERKVTGLPLLNDQGRLMGMVTKEQIFEKGLENFNAENKAVDYLTTRFLPLKEDALLEDVRELPFDIYPVLNNQEEITGVVTRYSLMNAYLQQVQLRSQELEAVFDSAHNGILAINKQGIITSLNPAAERPTMSTKEKAVGRFLNDIIIPTGLLEVVRSGIPEFGTKFKVGRRLYISNRTPIIKDGEVVGAVGVFQDVSELEKILQELRSVKQLNEELQTIIVSSYDGLIICDGQGEILRCNPAVGRILEVPWAGLVGKPFKDLVDNGVFQKNIIQLVKKQDGLASILERPFDKHSLVITGNPVYSEEGEIVKIVINIRDTSELVFLREALEESKQLSEKYQSQIVQMRNQQEMGAELRSCSVIMNNVMDLASRVSQVDSPVVLVGEQGVGKEEIAKLIHLNSKRSKAPFYKLNCGSLPNQLLEIELFGQGISEDNGNKGKAGVFELAEKGSVYLEDIGKMSLSLQGRLLRILQDKTLQVSGGKETISVDIRIIASSMRPLKELVEKGLFRGDLFFSLNVVPIKVPALRERKEDLIPLVLFHLEQNNKRHGLEKVFSPEAVHLFLNYPWLGNVREMANVIERLVVTSNEKLISAREVDHVLYEKEQSPLRSVTVAGVIPLKEAIDDLEQQLVKLAMKQHGTTVKAAEALGVNQSTVVRKLKKLKDMQENVTKSWD
ncbi:sigma-54-dependent Fis family transcriptional regulator [Desulfosporosinus sp. BICA1-9]|uniref:sigma-54-dependent Fis family transcriptional regulator n=1 Tax=Desulfosporosinus sp. BICA1-9 TaxID=1531958 RepID=UPI00054C017C|nr:sigma-54-dependent Fis family transcriptional regulator [Desulfosporosinus sp. BICA1-9]KJS88851.1 MAG: diguanylate cyclase [Desulfosporosinus sp. BICA1-9]HBW37279.1 PAS domain S-box protein [Desulfosporosinus sp.]